MALFNKDSVSPEPESSTPAGTRRAFGDAASVIGPGMKISGTVTGSDDTIVTGRIEGEVRIAARLRVEKGGEINATIHAEEIEIAGTVEGTLTAAKGIEIERTARVTGSVHAPVVVVHEGAMLDGRVSMSRGGQTEKGGVEKSR